MQLQHGPTIAYSPGMTPVLIALAMFLLAFAIPYHAPRLGLAGGALGMALAVALVLRTPKLQLDFDLSRPIGLALALYALLWVLISAAQLSSVRTPVR